MKREDRLLDYIGEIDSKYVEDAMHGPSEAQAPRTYWRKVRTKAIAAVACLALVMGAVLTARLLPQGTAPDAEDYAQNEAEGPAPDGTLLPADGDSPDAYQVVSWHGKSVQYSTAAALETAEPGTALTLYAVAKPDPQTLYEGKSLQTYEEEADALAHRAEQLAMLQKEGPELQYGERLYTEGLPDGTRWEEELFRERVAYYGELLDQYVKDGHFLEDQCAADLEQCEADAEAAAALALEARIECQREILQDLYVVFEAEGHAVSLDVDGTALNLTISPQDFTRLEMPESTAYVVFTIPVPQAEEDTSVPDCPPA